MYNSFNVGMSFRSLANVEQAFIHYLNCVRKKCLEFHRVRSADYAFVYGLSEEEYQWELNTFLSLYFDKIEPVEQARGAITSLGRRFPNMCVITQLDALHHARIQHWLFEQFDGWTPDIFHAVTWEAGQDTNYRLNKRDLCYVQQLSVFVTENPVHAQLIAMELAEVEVIMLEQPWTIDWHPMGASEFPTWETVMTEIHVLSNT